MKIDIFRKYVHCIVGKFCIQFGCEGEYSWRINMHSCTVEEEKLSDGSPTFSTKKLWENMEEITDSKKRKREIRNKKLRKARQAQLKNRQRVEKISQFRRIADFELIVKQLEEGCQKCMSSPLLLKDSILGLNSYPNRLVVLCHRLWLNDNAMFHEAFICFYVSEAKTLCFSLCSQMFDDVERCWIYNIQNVCHANEQLSLCHFFSINVL